jgi:glucokinase
MNDVAVGIDIGGTTIKLGLVRRDGAILARRRLAYAAMASFDDIVDRIAGEIGAMKAETGCLPTTLGIAAPGHACSKDGAMVDGTGNVPLLKNQSLAAALSNRLALPVATVNDGIAAALGELHFGAGRGLVRFVVITLGTGVGGGVVIGGQVVAGGGGEPPEIGGMVLDATLLDAKGGKSGTLEGFASAAGFTAAYLQQGGREPLPPEAIFARAAQGEEIARRAIEATARRIAQALGTMINLLNLQACLIGGGIAQAGDQLIEPVRSHLPRFTWPYLLSRSRLALAATGDDAGLLGAAVTAFAGTSD